MHLLYRSSSSLDNLPRIGAGARVRAGAIGLGLRIGFCHFLKPAFTDVPRTWEYKVKVLPRENTDRYSQYLRFMYCGILRVPAVVRDSVLRMLPCSQYFVVQCWGIQLCFTCFRVLYCGYCQVLAVFWPLVLRVLRVFGVPGVSTHSHYALNTNYTVHRFDNLVPVFIAEIIHGWPHEWELEKITFGGGNWST